MHRHQMELFGAFDHRALRLKRRVPQYFHTEWHRRARKTTGLINLQVKECCRVPKTKHVYVAPTQVQARNIVWDDPNMIRAALPDKREMSWKMNEQKMMIFFDNGSMYKLGGADEPDSWRGIDGISFVLDEWALMKYKLYSEIIRPILAGALHPNLDMVDVFRWIGYAYTPKGINHATQGFDDACMMDAGGVLPVCGQAEKVRDNCYASRLDGELSGILSKDELDKMKDEVLRGKIPQALYDQEIRCSRVTSEEMTLITTELIHALNMHHQQTEHAPYETRKIVSIDPAWGGDVCKIMGMVNCEVVEEKNILDRYRGSEIAMAAKQVAQVIKTKNFIVDTVNDNEVAQCLADDEAEYNVQWFKSSHKAREKEDSSTAIKYANCRAEAYAHTAKLIRSFEAGPITSQELIRQLPIASQYKTQGGSGKLIILPKTEIKKGTNKRAGLGRSPDDADCYIMGNWGLQFVDPEVELRTQYRDGYKRYKGVIRPESAMA